MMQGRSWFALGVLALVSGCATTPPRTATPVDAPLRTADLALGNWRVVSNRYVGVSALSRPEAAAWTGREARYSRTAAGFAPDTCGAPVYASRFVDVADVAADFHVRPSDLPFPGTRVQVVDVTCVDPSWTGPGARLYVLGPMRLITAWDGVFFELSRETGP